MPVPTQRWGIPDQRLIYGPLAAKARRCLAFTFEQGIPLIIGLMLSSGQRQPFETADNFVCSFPRLGNIKCRLQPEPEIRAPSKNSFKPKRHFGGNAALTRNDPVQLRPGDAQCRSSFANRDFKGKYLILHVKARMRRILHDHNLQLLVIVHKVNIMRVTVFKPKHNAPVCPNCDSPLPLPAAPQSVKAIRWQIQVLGSDCHVQFCQDQ